MLLHLGYPELAAGDARKACLLLEAAIDGVEDEVGENVKETWSEFLLSEEYDGASEETIGAVPWMNHVRDCLTELLRKTFRVLLKAVEFTMDPWGALQICRQAKSRFPEDGVFRQEFRVYKTQFEEARETTRMQGFEGAEANRQLVQGRVFLRQYPFVPREYLQRSEDLIASVQMEFEAASSKCELGRSTDLIGADESSRQSDVLGIFASSDIAAGDHLLTDPTLIGATTPCLTPNSLTCEACCGIIPPDSKQTVSADCCSAVYCSPHHHTLALSTYHTPLCTQNFTWLLSASAPATHPNHPALDGLLWLRVLALCVQRNYHPLAHPLLARLTPQYCSKTVHRWSYEWSVNVPMRILRQLGIDVWADPRFDTWVLQTVWACVSNNRNVRMMQDGRPLCAVNPLFSFFNHSCAPNAVWKPSDNSETSSGGTRLEITASRDVSKWEEVFVAYCDVNLSKPQRQERLLPWLGGEECHCSRCQREP